MTGQSIINASGRLIGELRGDRSFGAVESANLLESLNQYLGKWSQSRFAIHQSTRESLTLASAAASYTMGPSGNLNTTRPLKITAASSVAASGAQREARVVTAAEFATIQDTTVTGLFVEMVHPDYASPQITLHVWPKPSAGQLIVYSVKPLSTIATLGTSVSFPPGYEHALVYSFAEIIAAEFGRQPSPDVIAEAKAAREAIAATNEQLYPAAA